MVGDGPERIKAEQLSRNLGLEDRVEFLGKLRVIEKILSISDIFLLPSLTESFGLVALEAMASKTAVISTNSGGISEVNIDGNTGFMSNVGDVDQMAENTIYLLQNPDLLETFKMNALTHARSFSLKNVLPKYNTIYQKLCSKKKNRS